MTILKLYRVRVHARDSSGADSRPRSAWEVTLDSIEVLLAELKGDDSCDYDLSVYLFGRNCFQVINEEPVDTIVDIRSRVDEARNTWVDCRGTCYSTFINVIKAGSAVFFSDGLPQDGGYVVSRMQQLGCVLQPVFVRHEGSCDAMPAVLTTMAQQNGLTEIQVNLDNLEGLTREVSCLFEPRCQALELRTEVRLASGERRPIDFGHSFQKSGQPVKV